ncbi:MAG: flagellin, partial [Pseudomonadota bacterium]
GEALIGFTGNTSIARDTSGLDNVSVDTVTNAEEAIQRVDAALTTIASLRSEFGAIQNRFDSTIANLQTVSENLSASRGRILDADFAAETAQLTKAQILQQAGVSVLTQANAQPQLALSLLQ